MMSLLQVEFIMNYILSQHNSLHLYTLVSRDSFKLAMLEMDFLIKLINKWSALILQDHEHSIAINEIYEKVVRINKDRKKLEFLSKKLDSNSAIPQFTFNKEFNKEVERKMMGKEKEKRAFKTEKAIHSRKNI